MFGRGRPSGPRDKGRNRSYDAPTGGAMSTTDIPRDRTGSAIPEGARPRPRTSEEPSVLHDTRGAAMTEYAILVGAVAMACIGAFVALGVALVNDFELVRRVLLQPF